MGFLAEEEGEGAVDQEGVDLAAILVAIPVVTRVAQSAEAQKRRCTKILVVDENLDPQHTLFCREISFVANYAL